MKYLIVIITVFLTSFSSIAQIDEEVFEEKMEMNIESKDYSWGHKNFFIDFKVSVPEVFIRKQTTYEYYGMNVWDTEWDTLRYIDKGIAVSLIGLTLEPRINLFSRKNSAMHIKAPITLSISFTGKNNYNRTMGFGHVAIPIMLGYAKGFNSTYTSTKPRGFAISAGVQYMRTPLLGGELDLDTYNYDMYQGSSLVETRKNFIMPVMQLDYYYINWKGKQKGLSLTLAPYNGFYAKLAMNFIGSKK